MGDVVGARRVQPHWTGPQCREHSSRNGTLLCECGLCWRTSKMWLLII